VTGPADRATEGVRHRNSWTLTACASVIDLMPKRDTYPIGASFTRGHWAGVATLIPQTACTGQPHAVVAQHIARSIVEGAL